MKQGLEETKKFKNVLEFYLLATRLKFDIRSGWNETHWNIDKLVAERTAAHVYGTCILAIAFDSEFDLDVDLRKVILMEVIHELGEVRFKNLGKGDITPFDKVAPESKLDAEYEVFARVTGSLTKKDEYMALFKEFNEKSSLEAILAYICDKMDADSTSKIYQDLGYHHALSDQDGNVVMKNAKVEKMLEDGAKTAYDIWYEWDESLYKDYPKFQEFLRYIRDTDFNDILGQLEDFSM